MNTFFMAVARRGVPGTGSGRLALTPAQPPSNLAQRFALAANFYRYLLGKGLGLLIGLIWYRGDCMACWSGGLKNSPPFST